MPEAPGLLPDKDLIDQAIQQKSRQKFIREQKEEVLQRIVPNQVADEFSYLKDYQFSWNDMDKMQFDERMERPVQDKVNYDQGITGDMADSFFEKGSITADKMGNLTSDKVQNAVSYSAGITTITQSSMTINNGALGGLLIVIEDTDDAERVLFGHVEVSAYKGSVDSTTHVPRGSTTIASQHKVISYYDLHYNETSLGRPGKDLGYVHLIINNSGASDTYYFRYRWRYLGNSVDQ